MFPAKPLLRLTFVSLPNGERVSIKHGETIRRKRYQIAGMTFAQAQAWSDLFTSADGDELIVLVDDQSDRYPALIAVPS